MIQYVSSGCVNGKSFPPPHKYSSKLGWYCTQLHDSKFICTTLVKLEVWVHQVIMLYFCNLLLIGILICRFYNQDITICRHFSLKQSLKLQDLCLKLCTYSTFNQVHTEMTVICGCRSEIVNIILNMQGLKDRFFKGQHIKE